MRSEASQIYSRGGTRFINAVTSYSGGKSKPKIGRVLKFRRQPQMSQGGFPLYGAGAKAKSGDVRNKWGSKKHRGAINCSLTPRWVDKHTVMGPAVPRYGRRRWPGFSYKPYAKGGLPHADRTKPLALVLHTRPGKACFRFGSVEVVSCADKSFRTRDIALRANV